MRRIVTSVAATITAVVLLFSYHTSTNSPGSSVAAATSASSSVQPGTTSGGTASDGTTSGGTTSGAAAGSAAATTYTGSEAMTEWGVVQVEVTVTGGKVTSARTVQEPSENHRDVEINGFAVPVLNDEVVTAQSAGIDTVSGATVTSDGYIESLQSALDAAHLG